MRAFFITVLCLLLAAIGAWAWASTRSPDPSGPRTVVVERGTVARHAVAVGRVEPERETAVKSLRGGIVTRRFVSLGQKIAEGQPLVEVRPVTTEQTLVQAERAIAAATEGVETAREFRDGEHVLSYLSRMLTGGKAIDRMHRGANRAKDAAEQQLQLLREGTVEVDGRQIDFIVRAPVAGHVIEIGVVDGSPVVPSSNFGSGTVLVTIGDLDHPVFRGTVDEIDVGSLREGMSARVEIGALPDRPITGKLVEIGLKSKSRDNAVIFDVRLELTPPEETILRAGYSAIANVALDERRDVLLLPERVIEFRDGRAFVTTDGEDGTTEKEIETGLSDGLRVEIRGGLSEGDTVLERVHR